MKSLQEDLFELSKKAIKVSVVHGDLSFCNTPVVVGHFEGDGLYSAEKYLDYLLGGRLSARLKFGQYPGQEGTVEAILNDKGGKPGGAIIIGLGKVGELSPQKLTQTFVTAMQEYLIKALENDMIGENGEIAISTVLIGTGGSGLSIKSSIDAILTGIILTNRSVTALADTFNTPSNFRISQVDFIELYKDKAILAVKSLQTYLDSQEFSVNIFLQSLRGGRKRISYDYALEQWHRIYIREGENRSLIFSIPTGRARTEESYLRVQRRNIDRLIAQAVKDPAWDRNMAKTMFELMVPNRIKESFRDLNNIVIALDAEAARYPWELLYDHRTRVDSPLVVHVGMIRQFSTSSFQEVVMDEQNNNVLVIGNPANTPSTFENLLGAELEANIVADMFEENKNHWNVVRAIGTDSNTIMNSLFSKDYRILHLAGHGVYKYPFKLDEEEEPELITGMVLGDGVFLTANEIKNKTKIPEVVFINCCHLGKLDDLDTHVPSHRYAFNEFAASLSQEFIEMGVKAIVAAGWAVDDTAAVTFARVFYKCLFIGYQFGDAVKKARRETYRLHGDTNTWAAYQCYGNPAYELGKGYVISDIYVDIEEAILEVNNLFEIAKTASAQGIDVIRLALENLRDKIKQQNQRWLDDPRLLEALGQAFAEVFLLEEAAMFFDHAIKNSKSTASIKAIEQSANCHIRLAIQMLERDPRLYSKSKAEIEDQINTLTSLMTTLEVTPQRLLMVGSAYKRLALIASRKPSNVCNVALEKMEDYYYQAWELTKRIARGNTPIDPYPLTNALIARIVRLVRLGDAGKVAAARSELKKQKDEAQGLAEAMRAYAPESFWTVVGLADTKLLEGLIEILNPKKKGLPNTLHEELVNAYRFAWMQYGSTRELYSVIEYYAFLLAVLKEFDPDDILCGVLENIYADLRSMSEVVEKIYSEVAEKFYSDLRSISEIVD